MNKLNISQILNQVKNECLVFDIETCAFYPNGKEVNLRSHYEDYIDYAQIKYFGAYSYKTNKEYYLDPKKDLQQIFNLLESHSVLIGYNSDEFDFPILINNGFASKSIRYLNVDCMQVLGNNTTKNRNGFAYKNRGELMELDFKKHSLAHIAEVMNLDFQKGQIDFNIFHKDIWTKEETEEIKKYLKNDVMATKQMFDKLWDYWKPFTELLSEKDIRNLSWIRSSIASLTYKSACYFMNEEPTYSEQSSKIEEMGGRVLLPKYEEANNVWYIDFASLYPHIFCMFNLFAEKDSEKFDNLWYGNDFFQVKGHYDISTSHILSSHVQSLLKKRFELKEKDEKNPLIFAIKIFLNGLYGIIRSSIFEKVHTPNAGWDCCWLGQQIHEFVEEMMQQYGFEILQGDSVTKNTNIILPNKIETIENLWNNNNNFVIYRNDKEIKIWNDDKILSCDFNFKNQFVYPKEIVRHKCNKKIYKIEFTNQEHICITEDHSLIVLDENLQYKEITPKDLQDKKYKFLLYNKNSPILNIKSKNYQKEIYNLMGMFIANGNLESNSVSLSFEYINEYIENVLSHINLNYKIKHRQKTTDIRLVGKDIVNFLKNNELIGNSYTKRVPKWLFNESKENICEFLKGCMTGDGTVSIRKSSPIIRYTSINEDLIDDLKQLFLKVGISTSKIKETEQNNYKGKYSGTYSFHLNVLDKEIYKNIIGFSCKKKNNRIQNYTFSDFRYIHAQDAEIYHKKINSYVKKFMNNNPNDFRLRCIKTIKEIQYNDYVYDLSIPKYEKFYANNVLVHNTDSLFCKALDKKNNNREYVEKCLTEIVKIINDNVPFPVETFKLNIETYIDYLMCPFTEQPIKDEEGKNKKEGNRLIKERKGLKKNYLYIYKNKKNESDVKLVGLPIIKNNATKLGIKIYEEVLKSKILEKKSAKFSREFIDNTLNEYLKKEEILKLVAREFKVNPAKSYKLNSQIQAQISNAYFDGQRGNIELIKNTKVGKAGKGKLYCTIKEAIENKLTYKDIDLEKVYHELEPFIKYEESEFWVKNVETNMEYLVTKDAYEASKETLEIIEPKEKSDKKVIENKQVRKKKNLINEININSFPKIKNPLYPFKYPGNKKNLLPILQEVFKQAKCNSIYEAFAGSAVFSLNTKAKSYTICDTNKHVIDLWLNIKNHNKKLINIINSYNPEIIRDNQEYYIELRSKFNKLEQGIQKSALFHILLGSCTNGLARFNSKGEFNQTWGARHVKHSLENLESQVQKFNIILQSYEQTKIKDNTLLYLDPPYLLSNDCYTAKKWDEKEEEKFLNWLSAMNCKWALSNIISKDVRRNELLQSFGKMYNIYYLNKKYNAKVGGYSDNKTKHQMQEVLITNFEVDL